MENIFVTATNLYSVRAIHLALKQKKYIIASILSCATIGSVVYHLSETQHGMNPICLKDHAAVTLNIDRFFALCAMGLFAWKYKNKMNQRVIFYGSLGMMALM